MQGPRPPTIERAVLRGCGNATIVASHRCSNPEVWAARLCVCANNLKSLSPQHLLLWNLPQAINDTLGAATVQALASADLRERLNRMALELSVLGPRGFLQNRRAGTSSPPRPGSCLRTKM